MHVHDLKAPPDQTGAAKQPLHLLGRGVGGDVEILGCHAQQQVAYGAADDKGAKARLLQRVGHAHCVARDQRRVDTVFGGPGNNGDVSRGGLGFAARLLDRGRAACGFRVGRRRCGCGCRRACRGSRGRFGFGFGRLGLPEQFADEFFNHVDLNKSRIRQPRDCAWARNVSSGLVATGWLTFSSSGISFKESL